MCASRKSNVMVKILKILGWTLLTVVIVMSVLLFSAILFLNSKNLSSLVEREANERIKGHLSVGDVRVGFHPHFPILGVKVDSLSVISHAFTSLSDDERGLLPAYSDSLLSLDYLAGSLDIKRLIVDNEITLRDVVLRGLSVNMVIARDGKANYDILNIPADTAKTSPPGSKHPGFRINRFSLEQPREIRFYNAADSTSASVLLLTHADVDGDNQPTYTLKLSGDLSSRKATLVTNLDRIRFGLNGKVYWDPARPGLIAMDEMEIQGAFLRAIVTGEIDLTASPVIKKAVVEFPPVTVDDVLAVVPDSIRRLHRLYPPYFSTDLTVSGHFELTEPMNLATDSFPAARLSLYVPPSTLRYGRARFKELAMDIIATTVANRPDSTLVEVNRCIVADDKARFEATATLSTLFSDPSFSARLNGDIDLANLPPIIHEKIHGFLSGIVSTDLSASGRASMLRRDALLRLVADGSVTARNLYFLTADVNNLVQVNNVRIDFSSDKLSGDIPLLSARLRADTANILLGGVDLSAGALSLGVGVETDGSLVDSSRGLPIGGDLRVDRFNIISITDSAGARIRSLDGHIALSGERYPTITARLHPGHVSAGSLSDRFIIDDAAINAVLFKLPPGAGKTAASRQAHRPQRDYRYILPDSVFRWAYTKRHHRPGEKKKRRVYGTLSADNNEVLEWDLAKGFNRFLTGWKLSGSLFSGNARLLTPRFPLHNRFSKVDLRFSNDTVRLSDVSLRTGRSDIRLSGLVTNVRRALTSKVDNTLKINLSFLSDTIDINELSAGAMAGAAYAQRRRLGKIRMAGTGDDAVLEARLDALAGNRAGSTAPFLIPVNIDASLRVEAAKVLYSDLVMHNLGGDLLVYDGGVNLHNIRATSDAGSLNVSALYSAPKPENMHFGFGMALENFNIGKFVKLVPAVDSIIPLIHDFSGTIGADIAATCSIDSGMNLMLPTLDAAIRISGDNLAFIDPHTYRTLGKWLGFKNKSDNTIRRLNVEMTVTDGIMRVYPFTFNIDRYRLGVYGSNDIAMNFDYHLSVLKSPLPFKFGINISGNPKKYKVRFGGAKFNETTAVESVNVVNNARINLIEQIENVFKRGVQNSRFAKLQIPRQTGFETVSPDTGLNSADSLRLMQQGIIDANPSKSSKPKDKSKKKRKKFLFF